MTLAERKRLVETPAPRLHRTIWYMGAKARVIPDFLERVLEREVPRGGTIVDLMSGTGVVAAFCADRWRVFANDAQEYARVIARSLIEHDPEEKARFLAAIDPRRDLGEAYEENLEALEELYAPALAAEAAFLSRFASGEAGAAWCRRYREFLGDAGGHHGDRRGPGRNGSHHRARGLFSEASLELYRRNPRRRPACLVTAYYANVYFGLRQALQIDSLRAAIDLLSPRSRHARRKQAHYLSALLHAASVSTSGTSHFAQPRHLRKDTELRAMARRRRLDVFDLLEEYSREICETVRGTRYRRGNRCFAADYRDLIEEKRGRPRFRFPAKVDLIYLDPPYTADNYSRFYHVLETIARYDYPPLESDVRGRVLRGRYPEVGRRLQSDFCRKSEVEEAFRRVLRASAGSGVKLVISYADPSGLLLKRYAALRPGVDPCRQLEDLCREYYSRVTTERRALMHSGQGDSNIGVEELLVVCTRPR